MWELFKFALGIGCHLEVCQTVDNVQRHDITIVRAYALSASNFHGTVIDRILVVFNLAGRVYSTTFTIICILAHPEDDWTTLSLDTGRSIDKLECRKFVIVNTSDVHSASMLKDYLRITANNATICSPIDKGTAP